MCLENKSEFMNKTRIGEVGENIQIMNVQGGGVFPISGGWGLGAKSFWR